MKNKIVLTITITILFWFSSCSQKDYKNMYTEQYNIFNTHTETSAENNVKTMQEGENPMKRPSYDEYRQ